MEVEAEAEAILCHFMWKRKRLKKNFEIWKRKRKLLKKNFLFLKWKRKLWKILQSNGSGSGSFEIFFHKMEAEAEAPSKFTASKTLVDSHRKRQADTDWDRGGNWATSQTRRNRRGYVFWLPTDWVLTMAYALTSPVLQVSNWPRKNSYMVSRFFPQVSRLRHGIRISS